MLYLFIFNAFVSDFYFVFTTFIRLVFFRTVITFRDIFAFFINVFIFITIKVTNKHNLFVRDVDYESVVFRRFI